MAALLVAAACSPNNKELTDLENKIRSESAALYPPEGQAVFAALLERLKSDSNYEQELQALDSVLEPLVVGLETRSIALSQNAEDQGLGTGPTSVPDAIVKLTSALNQTFGDIYREGQKEFIAAGLGYGDGIVGGDEGNVEVKAGVGVVAKIAGGVGIENIYDFRGARRTPWLNGQAGLSVELSSGGGVSGCAGVWGEAYADWICGIPVDGVAPGVSVGVSAGLGIGGTIAYVAGASVSRNIEVGQWTSIDTGTIDGDELCNLAECYSAAGPAGAIAAVQGQCGSWDGGFPAAICGHFGSSGSSGITIGSGVEGEGCIGVETSPSIGLSAEGTLSISCAIPSFLTPSLPGWDYSTGFDWVGDATFRRQLAGWSMAADLVSMAAVDGTAQNWTLAANHLTAAGLASLYALLYVDDAPDSSPACAVAGSSSLVGRFGDHSIPCADEEPDAKTEVDGGSVPDDDGGSQDESAIDGGHSDGGSTWTSADAATLCGLSGATDGGTATCENRSGTSNDPFCIVGVWNVVCPPASCDCTSIFLGGYDHFNANPSSAQPVPVAVSYYGGYGLSYYDLSGTVVFGRYGCTLTIGAGAVHQCIDGSEIPSCWAESWDFAAAEYRFVGICSACGDMTFPICSRTCSLMKIAECWDSGSPCLHGSDCCSGDCIYVNSQASGRCNVM